MIHMAQRQYDGSGGPDPTETWDETVEKQVRTCDAKERAAQCTRVHSFQDCKLQANALQLLHS